jgi:hypothetical protein
VASYIPSIKHGWCLGESSQTDFVDLAFVGVDSVNSKFFRVYEFCFTDGTLEGFIYVHRHNVTSFVSRDF